MRILGLIPARGGSKGIPRKNIKLLQGKALICYSIEVGLDCSLLDQVVVSTDDREIADISLSAGAEVPFMRPANLASDTSPSIDTVVHALHFFEEQGQPFDAVCLLQPTVPFRNCLDLTAAIKLFKQKAVDSLVSVREVPHAYNPHWVYEKDEATGFLGIATGEKKIITRRQDLPKAYYRDGAIYITKSAVVLKQNSLYGKTILPYVMHKSPAINIDTMEDWEEATAFAKDHLTSKNA